MSVIHETGPCTSPPKTPSLTFPYEPDHFQNHSFNAIESGNNVLVTAHTGSGKTSVAEYSVAYGIKSGKRVIYTAPIKALSNQIFGDFSRKYPSWSLGIRTGDIDFRSDDAQVVIMTTEILLNMLYRKEADLEDNGAIPTIDFDNVSVVIFDEVHYIKDRERGSVWERSIMMMPKHIQMVMLSATLPDAHQFCEWIAGCTNRDITHTTTPFRAVPLTHYIMTERGLRPIMENNKFDPIMYHKAMDEYSFKPSELDNYIKRMRLPALFFCFSKKHCQSYTRNITASVTTVDERTEIKGRLNDLIRKFPNHKDLMGLDQTKEVFGLAAKGVCYHHAGLLPPLKEIIQELFSAGLIKVLFVTETFAAGVNMPAKTVVFTGLTKYDDHAGNGSGGGFRILLPEEYGQMAGRAGRRGMDTEGVVIHLPFDIRHHPNQRSVYGMMCGQIQNIKSRIKPDYHHVFNSIQYNTDLLSQGSMLDRDQKSQLTACREALQKCETDLATAMEKLEQFESEHDLNDLFYDRLDMYRKFHRGELKGSKAVKKYQKSGTEQWYLEHSELCDSLIKLENDITDMESSSENLHCQIDILANEEADDLTSVTEFLSSNGYLRGDKTLEEYTPNDMTVKGIMASGINEANCLLLTELIIEGYLDDLDCLELTAVLAIFLATKESERDLNVPHKVTDRLAQITSYSEQFAVAESKFSACESDWEIHREFCDMAYWWVKTCDVNTVYSKTKAEVQVGEFARMMVKLSNICREALKAAQISHKDDLSIKLRECQELLIRGVVFPQSLYVNR